MASLSTAGLARASARRPWLVVGFWLAIVIVAAFGAAVGLNGALTTDSNFLSHPESVRANDILNKAFPGPDTEGETILVRSATYTVDQPQFRAEVQQLASNLAGMHGVVVSVETYYGMKAAGSPLAEATVSKDRHTTLIPVTLDGDFSQANAHYHDYLQTIQRQRVNGFQVYSVGNLSVNDQFNSVAQSDLHREILGLPAALVILVIVFGALVAAGVPIALGLVAIIVAVGLTALIAQFFQLSTYTINMITVIGLAVGIDYALFIVERYREERRRGADKLHAIELAGGTASKAVTFSGMTVMLALCGMFLIPTTIFRSLGTGAILVTLAAMGAMLTLVPALLSLLGDKIDWPRRRRYGAETAALQRAYDQEMIHRGFWGTITKVVMRRPVVSAILAAAFLAALAWPFFELTTGTSGVETLPASDAKTAFTILQTEFYAGVLNPVNIVVDAPRSASVETGIARLRAELARDPAFGPVLDQQWSATNEVAQIRLPLKDDPNAPSSYAAISRLRHTLIPAAFAGTPASGKVLVGGQTAFNADFNQVVHDWTPVVFAFVLGLSFLLLLLAFRSLVVPLKAIAMNLLSVGAAYGLMVLVFQKGYLHRLFGFQKTPTIDAWIPIFLFCVLFGLSMDYHVFLLSRIREHYDQTGNNREAVASGLQATAKIITGAALIMVVVFGAFATGQLVMFQQVGFGLAVAILLDATVIRSVLVPAAMALLGDRNWYLPRWLFWLPDLRIEGAALHRPAGPVPVAEVASD